MRRSNPSNAAELEVLLRQMLTTPTVSLTTRHDSVPSLQGRLVICHRAYCNLNQTSNFDI